jgi:hypothetical protein
LPQNQQVLCPENRDHRKEVALSLKHPSRSVHL